MQDLGEGEHAVGTLVGEVGDELLRDVGSDVGAKRLRENSRSGSWLAGTERGTHLVASDKGTKEASCRQRVAPVGLGIFGEHEKFRELQKTLAHSTRVVAD